MSLSPGTRLGHYEITEPIGAGGMGEVYKAIDTRLDRTVAIKVLAAHLADSPERKQRFEREARTISKLNHPNICTLYDIGSQDGTDFLVMEFIEGETLADRLTRGPLSCNEALEYAIQITDALAKAHRAGIVHRDLKPANIMLTKMGVKLLDFGLAKLVETESGAADSSAPTVQKDLTHERAVIGTPRYMAPEQLAGAKADARTDLYAFGLVLREMLTGKKSPMSSDDSINDSIEGADVARVLTKCLAEDPDERWQTARDLSDELRWLVSKPSPAGVPSRKPHALLLTGLVGAVVASITWWLLPGRELERRSPVHFRLQPPEGYVFRGTTPWSNPLGISPDGTQVILTPFDSNGVPRLFVHAISEPDAREVPRTESAHMPFFSWDGSFVAYSTGNELWRLRLSGGAPEKISDVPRLKAGAAWGSPDGRELFYRNGRAVMAAVVETEPSFRAGRPEQLFTGPYATSEDSGSAVGGQYDVSPDGKHFLMIENTVQSEAELHVILNWGEELKRLVPPDNQ